MSVSLKGTNVVFTGTFPGFTRAELEEMAGEYGFTLQKTVTRSTNMLVAADDAGEVKLKKARELGVKIWKPEDFLLMLGADEDAGITQTSPKPGKKTQAEEKDRIKFYETNDEAGMF